MKIYGFFFFLLFILCFLIVFPIRFKKVYQFLTILNSLILLGWVSYFIIFANRIELFFIGLFYSVSKINFFFYDYTFFFCFDKLSILLIFLTIFLYFICLCVIWNIQENFKLLNILLYLVICFVLLSFMTFDLLIFYIFF